MHEKEPNSKYLFSAYQKEKDKSKIKILRFVISINSNLDGFVHADMTRKTDFICQQKKGIPIQKHWSEISFPYLGVPD